MQSAQMSDRTFQFVYFRDFSSQSHVLNFAEYLTVMPSVLVAGSERRKIKTKKYK